MGWKAETLFNLEIITGKMLIIQKQFKRAIILKLIP